MLREGAVDELHAAWTRERTTAPSATWSALGAS
jgi:hypothetical protein